MRLLIVDDEPNTRDILVRLFARIGVEATAVGTADEALSVLEGGSIAAVLMDFNLEGVTGVELAERIRQRWPSVVRICLSGDLVSDPVFHQSLLKPVRLVDLKALAERLGFP